MGGGLRFTHPLRWRYTRAFAAYRFEHVNLTELSPFASQQLLEAARIHNISAICFSLRRDSRDAIFTHIVDHEDNEMMRPTSVQPNSNATRTFTNY